MLSSLQNSKLLLALAAVALLSIPGCSDSNWGHVTGTVSLQGQPVGPGSLMFEPEGAATASATSAIAHFREDGKYELKSAGNRKGAPIGTYLVMIHGRSEESFGDEVVNPDQKSVIPHKYMNHRLSGLKATIKPGSQTIDFDLTP